MLNSWLVWTAVRESLAYIMDHWVCEVCAGWSCVGCEVNFTKKGGKNLKGCVKIVSYKHNLKFLFSDLLKILDVV